MRTVKKSNEATESSASERVRGIVASVLELDVTDVEPDAHVYDDLGADSLEKVEIAMRVEGDFDVSISADEAAGVGTVNDVVALLEAKGAL